MMSVRLRVFAYWVVGVIATSVTGMLVGLWLCHMSTYETFSAGVVTLIGFIGCVITQFCIEKYKRRKGV